MKSLFDKEAELDKFNEEAELNNQNLDNDEDEDEDYQEDDNNREIVVEYVEYVSCDSYFYTVDHYNGYFHDPFYVSPLLGTTIVVY